MLLTRILLVQWLTMRVLHRWGNLRAWSTHIPSTAWIAQCDLWSINAFLRALEGARRLMLRSMAKSCNADPAVPLAWLLLLFSMSLCNIAPACILLHLFTLPAAWFYSATVQHITTAAVTCLKTQQRLEPWIGATRGHAHGALVSDRGAFICRYCRLLARLMDHRRLPQPHMQPLLQAMTLWWTTPARLNDPVTRISSLSVSLRRRLEGFGICSEIPDPPALHRLRRRTMRLLTHRRRQQPLQLKVQMAEHIMRYLRWSRRTVKKIANRSARKRRTNVWTPLFRLLRAPATPHAKAARKDRAAMALVLHPRTAALDTKEEPRTKLPSSALATAWLPGERLRPENRYLWLIYFALYLLSHLASHWPRWHPKTTWLAHAKHY